MSSGCSPLARGSAGRAADQPGLPSTGSTAGGAGAGHRRQAQLRRVATSREGRWLSKFFDINLTQLFAERPIRDTVEIRILPGMIDTDEIMARAVLIEQLLERCLHPTPFPMPPDDPEEAVAQLLRIARLHEHRGAPLLPEFT